MWEYSSADVHIRCADVPNRPVTDHAADPPRSQDLEVEVGKLLLMHQADPARRVASK
jgi:hypothetical protein